MKGSARTPGLSGCWRKGRKKRWPGFQKPWRRGLRTAATAAVLSAHSLPEDLVRQGDPYLDNVMHSAAMLQEELGDVTTQVGFQSKGRAGMEWLKPETDEVLRQIAARGVKGVAIAPISFVAENIETLYDCDILQKSLAESLGMKYARIKNFDDDADFIKFLAELAIEGLA